MKTEGSHNYYVYITTNPRKTVLYTGMTNNLLHRLKQHFYACGEKRTFAGRYYCYRLVYYEWFRQVEDAICREKEIKGWTRAKKEALIESVNPNWYFLSEPYFVEDLGKFCGNV